MLDNREYDAATVALRVLRLVTVACIFAFVLTVRTIAPIHASSGEPADDAAPVAVDPSPTDPVEEPPIDPPPLPEPPPVEPEPPPADPVEPPPGDSTPVDTSGTVQPPTDPPVEAEPPPADTVVEPAPSDPPTDPPPADTVVAEPPTEPPVEAEPPPADTIEPTPTDPPADPAETVLPPPDPPADAEPPPGDAVEPAPADPPVTDALPPPLEDPSIVGGDPTGSHPSTAQSAPSVPSTHRSAVPAPRVADNPAQAAKMPVALIMSTLEGQTDPSPERAHTVALHPAIAAGAGLAAGLAITNHAPSSVAVAIEFGRAGGGWAGALVFNLWLRRQMRERRMSQRRLAALADVDHSTISRLLRQDRRPSLTTATKLARALKQVPWEGAEPEAVDYFERVPEETVFPARRVELALRADEMLNDEQVRRLMNMYLDARRRNDASASGRAAATRGGPARAAPDLSG